MSLSKEDILQVANLAYLSLSPSEVEHYTEQLSQTLQFIEQMNQVDTTHITPCIHVNPFPLPLRRDCVSESDQHAALQKIAPQTKAGFYLVPTVLEDPSFESEA